MTIHSDHPFLPPSGDRDPVRRFRGRMVLPVGVWTTQSGDRRVGWTVASMLVAAGEPPELLGLVDEDSDLADLLGAGGTVAVSLLRAEHRGLADAFAGAAPAPGGAFRLGTWTDTAWGPVLAGAAGWLGARVTDASGKAGWTLLVRAVIEHAEVEAGDEPGDVLAYLRGRYRSLDLD